jgi:hypothetical protein
MLADGTVVLLGEDGSIVPHYRARVVIADPASWGTSTPYALSLTEVGAARIR